MIVTVNGEQTEIGEGLSVSDLLAYKKVRMPDMVSVELNSAIIDRKRFSDTFLKQGDKIEFLYFMGGG